MKNLYFIFLFSNYLVAQDSILIIQGECHSCPNQQVYITQILENGETFDTINMINEKYIFKKQFQNEEWLRISFQHKNKFIELFTFPGDQIQLISHQDQDIEQTIIKGSQESINRINYIKSRSRLGHFRSSLLKNKKEYEESGATVPMELQNQIDSLNSEIEAMTFETIMTTKSLLLKDLCLMWINSNIYIKLIQRHLDSISITFENNHDFKNLQSSFQYYLEPKLKLSSLLNQKIALEFSFINQSGNIISKSDIGNKYLFMDFWASWCRPCRVSNKKINQNQEIFQNDKLYPLFISLDKDSVEWEKAIKEDNLQWAYHGIDVYNSEKSFAKSLGISLIPTNLLIAPNGQIILQNATPEDVKAFLDKLK